nr:vitronectin [Pelodiscus sinensis]|eukprot:XP_006118079.1 vitronectin [Pelodiscus sinensis]
MRLLVPALLLGLLRGALAAEESCVGHCEDGFDAQRKCQCDALCTYYQSCCSDYVSACKPKVTRGDMFAFPEDDYVDYATNTSWSETTETGPTATAPELVSVATTDSVTVPDSDAPLLVPSVLGEQEEVVEEVLCSGQPFDAFTDLKNGSLYAFRGKYFYELDEKSVRPGYPKLIRDVWGIEGPVDAAFTRINCQGKTYIFKGSLYWRFDDGALDPDYPRNISEGFQDIPDNLDAAFALPAHSYSGKERVYFFKDEHYWEYDFANQPSRQDCELSSPSLVFDHYTLMRDDTPLRGHQAE